jgi:hypothetical protein
MMKLYAAVGGWGSHVGLGGLCRDAHMRCFD